MIVDARRVSEALDYCPETGVMTWRAPSWNHSEKAGSVAGSPRMGRNGKSYWVIGLDGQRFKRSRLAYAWVHGTWPPHLMDHRDGNSLNDKWENLRPATTTQNAWNHRKRARRIQLPMGVRHTASGRFAARLCVNKRMHHLGAFDTPEEAASAYRSAREAHYGEFA